MYLSDKKRTCGDPITTLRFLPLKSISSLPFTYSFQHHSPGANATGVNVPVSIIMEISHNFSDFQPGLRCMSRHLRHGTRLFRLKQYPFLAPSISIAAELDCRAAVAEADLGLF